MSGEAEFLMSPFGYIVEYFLKGPTAWAFPVIILLYPPVHFRITLFMFQSNNKC